MCWKEARKLWYNEHKSAHLKSSLRNFICAEKLHKNYDIIWLLRSHLEVSSKLRMRGKATQGIWYNEHKSAHLKSSLQNFICAEKLHKNYDIMSTKEKNQHTIKYNTDIKQWVAFCINPTDVRLAISLLFCFY